MHAAAFCKVFTCHKSLYDRIHMFCITIKIMIATFTPVVADLPLLPSRGKFNPALGQIYPHATFTSAWCIRGMSFFKFTPAIPLGFVRTSSRVKTKNMETHQVPPHLPRQPSRPQQNTLCQYPQSSDDYNTKTHLVPQHLPRQLSGASGLWYADMRMAEE